MVRTFHRGYTIEISGVPLILYVAICGIATNSARLLWNDINRHLRENKTPESFCKFRNFLIHRFGSPRSPITFTHRSPIQNINQRFGSFSFWFAFGCGWALYVLFAPVVSHHAFRLFFEDFSALRKVLEKFEKVIDSDTLWPFSINVHHHLRKRILVFVAE